MERNLGQYDPSTEKKVEIPTLRPGLDRYPDPELDAQPIGQNTIVTSETNAVQTDDPELKAAMFSGRTFWEK